MFFEFLIIIDKHYTLWKKQNLDRLLAEMSWYSYNCWQVQSLNYLFRQNDVINWKSVQYEQFINLNKWTAFWFYFKRLDLKDFISKKFFLKLFSIIIENQSKVNILSTN